ncbi:MAG: riboflavin synthase [Phycisphaera sp.]|nr:riboflavin synthase [Phycisphaera sp.]
MFTGLVQALGTVRSVEDGRAGRRIRIGFGAWTHLPEPGASIAVNGCCLTVAAVERSGERNGEHIGQRGGSVGGEIVAAFDAIPQTLAVTAIGALAQGSTVNLEHAATASTYLGGHVVLGHVDGLAKVVGLETHGEWRLRVALPAGLGRLAVDKGSIALDGVSLTIARVEDLSGDRTVIDVCLIPETLARTNLGARVVGDAMHVEMDHLAKLVARQMERWQATAPRG